MKTAQEVIVPYISYITLGCVVLVISLMILFKIAARDNRFLSNSELYIYSRPDLQQRKNNLVKKQRKNTFLSPVSSSTDESVPRAD